jgi:hypothetical protein
MALPSQEFMKRWLKVVRHITFVVTIFILGFIKANFILSGKKSCKNKFIGHII